MNSSISHSSDFHGIQYEGFEVTKMEISKLLPYSSDMYYKDRFGVYYVNRNVYSNGNKSELPLIREIQVPKYDSNVNDEKQSPSNTSISQCRQFMKKKGKSDSITLSSRFLYSVPPIHFNNSIPWNIYVSKARDSIKNKSNQRNKKSSLDGPFLHTPIGTFVENVRYNTQKSIIEVLIPNAHPKNRNGY